MKGSSSPAETKILIVQKAFLSRRRKLHEYFSQGSHFFKFLMNYFLLPLIWACYYACLCYSSTDELHCWQRFIWPLSNTILHSYGNFLCPIGSINARKPLSTICMGCTSSRRALLIFQWLPPLLPLSKVLKNFGQHNVRFGCYQFRGQMLIKVI